MSEAASAEPAAPAIPNSASAPGTPLAPLTPETAAARLEAIKSDPAWVAAFSKGDIKATAEHAELWRMIYSTADQQTQATAQAREKRSQFVDQLRSVADIPDAVKQMVVDDTPVSAHERQLVEQEWQRLKSDSTWVKGWLSGGRKERTQKTLIDIVMARPVIEERA